MKQIALFFRLANMRRNAGLVPAALWAANLVWRGSK